MLNSINSDLIRGHIDTIILSVLHEGDRYGYDILGEIEKKSNGQYSLKQPTLYSCLKRLESQGFIYKYWGAETNGGRRTYYSLTEMGKELFRRNKDEWEHSRGIIDKLISASDSPVAPYIVADVTASAPDKSDNIPSDAAPLLTESVPTQDPEKNTENLETHEDKITEDRYIEILAETEKNDIINETKEKFSVTESSTELKSVSYADKLNEEPVETRESEKERDPSLIESVYMSDNVSDYFNDYDENEEASEDDSDEEILVSTFSEDHKAIENETQYDENEERLIAEDEDKEKEILKPDYDDKNNLFRSYNNAELSEETDREMIVAREYRNVIRRLLKGNRDDDQTLNYRQAFENEEVPAQQIASTVTENNTEYQIHDDSQADFSNLLVAVRSMGDDIRIRTHNSNTDKEYSNLYHYYSNKLLLFKYGILFLLMICEIIIPYLIIKFAIGIEIKYELITLVLTVVGSAILPIYAVSANLIDPYKKKRYNFELKNSLLFRIAIMVLMIVLTYAANVVLYMDISFDAEYAFSLVTPALLSTNIPLSAVIFQALYDSKKFCAE